MKTILIVFGTRPEAIKMCPVVKELQSRENIKTLVCVTGQHREMLDQVLMCFDLIPDYDLSIMKDRQSLFDITNQVLKGIKCVIEESKPDIILVHGDTTTTFAASLAAFYLEIPVGHVEAGLRTYDTTSPYPEEFNRQATDSISKYFFAPTKKSKQNLINEGKPTENIFITGNTVIDALKTTINKKYFHHELDWAADSYLVLLTAHRRENLGVPLRSIFTAVRHILDNHNNVKVIYPVHLNPAIKQTADDIFIDSERIHIIEPLDVFDFHNFMNKSHIILTDSGGIQEEAPSLGKPVLVMRNTTERPEGVEAGTLKLVGTNTNMIYNEFKKIFTNNEEYERMSKIANPYGDGTASKRIADVLEKV